MIEPGIDPQPTWQVVDTGASKLVQLDLQAKALHVGFNGKSIKSRPFKLLRTQLVKALDSHNARLVGLTSPAPAVGKSFLSLNIAASLAQLNDRPVYLVDLDLRRASLAEQLSLQVDRGVDSFIRGESDSLHEIEVRIEGSPLVCLPTSQVTSGTEEYLSSPRFSLFVDTLRALSDNAIILFDLPPVFASDDAMLCIQAFDGYLMAVDARRTGQRQLREAIDLLRPAPMIGSVLNQYKGGMLDSYGYYSHTYDRYYAPE